MTYNVFGGTLNLAQLNPYKYQGQRSFCFKVIVVSVGRIDLSYCSTSTTKSG